MLTCELRLMHPSRLQEIGNEEWPRHELPEPE
jgi:hypothetical protein